MTRYTATARREGRWWVIQCDQHPGALSQVARLDHAAEVHREAIAFVVDVDESDVEVDVRPVLEPAIAEEVHQAEQLAAQAEDAERQARERRRAVARKLADSGLTVRDIGAVLGISYQRAHQLLNAPGKQPVKKARSRRTAPSPKSEKLSA